MFTWNRDGVELSGKWRFCPDPMQRCRRQQWWRNPSKKNSMFPCWDKEGLWEIEVPGSWKSQIPELKWYDGYAVYLRDFEIPELPEGQEAFLVFDGILYSAQIYLNGQLAGEHDWGYSPFQIRVTDLLRQHNRLFVLVENLLKPDRVPGIVYDWCNDGGIVNGVKLVFVPQHYIRNFQVSTMIRESEVEISVSLAFSSRDINKTETATISLPELGISEKVQLLAGTESQVKFCVARERVTLWCPENPHLYRLEIQTGSDRVSDEVGLREIRTDGGIIKLNGEQIRLYGVCVHSEFKTTGRTATPAGVEQVIRLAKELGANFLRCAHYPYAEIFGRALDKAGLLWWEEVPAYWLSNMHEEGQSRMALGMLEETLRRDWNRASLIIWSVSNECCWRNPENPKENNYPYWFKAVSLIRRLDPSRLISCAEAGNMISVKPTWAPGSNDEFTRDIKDAETWCPGHTDEWYHLFDVLSANLYVSSEEEIEPLYARYVEMFRRYNKPLLVSEFGSQSVRESNCPPDQLGSEERHARILQKTYEVFMDLPEIMGYCPWSLVDVRAVIHWRWYNRGKGVFRYGMVDENFVKKELVFNALRSSIHALAQHFAGEEAPRK